MRRVAWIAACTTALVVSCAPPAGAQAGGSAPVQAAAPAEAPKDALGRDTPRGTLLGFMRAGRDQNDEAAVAYLNTNLRGRAAIDLAHHLYVVLDSRLPARLADVSDRPEGGLANPLKPDLDVIGTIQTADGPIEILVEHVKSGAAGRVWLFSRQTLAAIPDVYSEIDVVKLDRFVPRFLIKFRIAGVRVFDWLLLVVGLPLFYRLVGALAPLLAPLSARWQRRPTGTTTRRTPSVPGFLRLLLIAIVLRQLMTAVDLPLIERQFWSTVSAMLAIVAAVWVLLVANARGEEYLGRRFTAAGPGEIAALLRLVRRVADVLVIAAAGIATLKFFGVDPTAALAGLGIGGIAVALAAQKTLENVIGGLSIIFDKAVRVGDFLKIGDTVGTVDYIGLRSTRIRTLDRTIVSVPNGHIANVGIETLSVRDKYWFHHFISLRLDTTPQQLNAIIGGIRSQLESHASIEPDSVRVRFFRVAPSSLDLELFAYVSAADWVPFLEIQEQLLLGVLDIVERAGTALAYPSQTLYFGDSNVVGAATGGVDAVHGPARLKIGSV